MLSLAVLVKTTSLHLHPSFVSSPALHHSLGNQRDSTLGATIGG